jgi:hypothetical protein
MTLSEIMVVIASEAKQSTFLAMNYGLLRRPVGLLAMTILYRLKTITL